MLNQTLQIVSLVLCGTGLLQVAVGPKQWKEIVRFYLVFYITMAIYSTAILAGLNLGGKSGEAVYIILRASVFLEFLSAYYLTYIVMNLLLFRIDRTRQDREIEIYRTIVTASLALQVLLLTVSQFTNYYYMIDSANVYNRNGGYWLHTVMWVTEYLFGVFIFVRHRKKLTKKSMLGFLLFVLCVGIACVLQVLIEGVYFITIATTVNVLALYIFVVLGNTEKYYENEQKISRLKVDIMLSQIQPHFIFNTLTTIKYFCRHDPLKAERAITDFSAFLRGNMDSINSGELIPFNRELCHTEAYLSLEKLRFGEALNIVYDIESEDFFLPPLTLQPIVENAVRHGVRGTEEGKGTVVISSSKHDDCYKITVTDDGAGFDPTGISETGESHIGIRNVRYRLNDMCGGTLSFKSAAGQGTVAVISIPKK